VALLIFVDTVQEISMTFELPPLPFSPQALEPHMSARTLEFHHGKHHKAYVDTTNKLVAGTPLEKSSLEDIIGATAKDGTKQALFNAAAQVWNHTFFWHSLMPKGGGKPKGEVLQALDQSFGGYDKFREEFKTACVGQFGSGWGWLVLDGDKLRVQKTPNAVNPLSQGNTALLTCDVWEHAYYLDFQNRRPDFVDAFLDHLVNWDQVAMRLKSRTDKAA
jgi:Fe-Mn family superoxide dismutase